METLLYVALTAAVAAAVQAAITDLYRAWRAQSHTG
jgi:hypothetical protein